MKTKQFGKIYIEITNVCNLKCSFCTPTKRKPEFMGIEDFKNILKKIKPYTDRIYLHIKGEPLLHPNIKEILESCEQEKIDVTITTNSTLLKKNLETILNVSCIKQMNLSLHSIEQNKEVYNKEEYLKEVISCVREIRKYTEILISYRLWNLEEYKNNEHNKIILNALANEYKIPDLYEIAKKNKWVKLDNSVYLNQDKEFIWPSLDGKTILTKGKCFGLRNQIGILVNGDVVPCCLEQNGDIVLGNIKNQTIEEILNTEKAKKIKQGFEAHKLVEPLCRTCGFITRFNKKEED